MKIGVTGDTHNNLKNIEKICTIFNKNGTDIVFHTGDITLPKSLLAFKNLNCPLVAVFGNNDIEERDGLEEISKKFNCNLYDEPFFVQIKNVRISILHHPDLIDQKMLLDSDIVLHGHTHRYRNEIKNNCIIFNPGECAGIMRGKNNIGLIDLKDKNPYVINF